MKARSRFWPVALAALGLVAAAATVVAFLWDAKSRQLRSALHGCTRVHAWLPGVGYDGKDPRVLTLMEISASEAIERLRAGIRVQPQWFEEESLPVLLPVLANLDFFRGKEKLATLQLANGTHLWWEGGKWTTDGTLTPRSAKFLMDLLDGPEARIPCSVGVRAFLADGLDAEELDPVLNYIETVPVPEEDRSQDFGIFREPATSACGFWDVAQTFGSAGIGAETALRRRLESVRGDSERASRLCWALYYCHSEEARATFSRAMADPSLQVHRLLPPGKQSAVEWGLRYLAGRQATDGRWDAVKWGAQGASDTEVTALALLAFLGAGYTGEAGSYKPTVKGATAFLRSVQNEQGVLGKGGLREHALAALALSHLHGITTGREPDTERPVARAVQYVISQQGEDGGWSAGAGKESDPVMSVLCLQLLKSSKVAGIAVPSSALTKAWSYFRSAAVADHRGRPQDLAAVWLAPKLLGASHEPERESALGEAIASGRGALLNDPLACWHLYLANFARGGEAWQKWHDGARKHILDLFNCRAPDFGGWQTGDSEESKRLGRAGTAALRVLSLEVYYRYLPLLTK